MLERATGFIRRFVPESLSLNPVWLTVDTGLKACIDSQLTLEMFAVLSVTQPYACAFDVPEKIDFVVDLGANRGLFLLFVCHYLAKRGRSERPDFLCVEAAEPNFRRLVEHIEVNGLSGRVTAVQGAVCGRRTGRVEFYYSPRAHGMGGIVSRRKLTTRCVPVIDLAEYVGERPIDLLKIDIEGAEEEFLCEYAELLARTRAVVAEFHLKEIDYARCEAALNESGLRFARRTFQFKDTLCVDVFTRPANSP